MKRFFSVVGAFIIATGLSCAMFTGLGFADSVDSLLEETEDVDYEAIRTDALATIDEYLESLENGLEDDELKNKNINAKEKAKVVAAYYLLTTEDQEPYTELIERIKRGGVPELEFIGVAEYDSADDIDYYQVIKATDNEDNNEDGVMELSADNTSCELIQQYALENATYQPYNLVCRVTDSDDNTNELTQEVRIKVTTPDETEKPDENQGDGSDKDPDDDEGNSGDDDKGPNQPDDDKGDLKDPDGDKQPDDTEKPEDKEPEEGGDDGNQGEDKEPGDGTSDQEPGDDNSGDDSKPSNGDNDGDDGDGNQPSGGDQSGDDNQDTPNTPGSTNTDTSDNNTSNDSKLPTTLPNTGPSAFFSSLPTSIYFSLLIGLVVATTVFCLTKKTTEAEALATK